MAHTFFWRHIPGSPNIGAYCTLVRKVESRDGCKTHTLYKKTITNIWIFFSPKDDVLSKEGVLEISQLTLKLIHKVDEDFRPLVKILQDVTNRLQPYERKIEPSLLQEKAASLTVPDEDVDNFIIGLIHSQKLWWVGYLLKVRLSWNEFMKSSINPK